MPGFVSGLFGGGHAVEARLKLYTLSITDFSVMHKPSTKGTTPDFKLRIFPEAYR
jgi:hypothetical protein